MRVSLLKIIYLNFRKKCSHFYSNQIFSGDDTKEGPVLRQGCLNPKEIEGKNCSLISWSAQKKSSAPLLLQKPDMNLFRQYNIFEKKMLTKSWKKHAQKSLRYTPFFSSLLPWATQTAQTEEFMFQNMAYRPTVYKTGNTST